MARDQTRGAGGTAFEPVRAAGLMLPDVSLAMQAGSPRLKRSGAFMACLATDPSAEPDTLVVRYDLRERDWLLEDAPETYYLTDYYRRWPVILVRLSRVTPEALRELLTISWRLTGEKVGRRAGYSGRSSASRRSR
jgi:hypothetical protein